MVGSDPVQRQGFDWKGPRLSALIAGVLGIVVAVSIAGAASTIPQDDAGTGTDAPDRPSDEIWITSGETVRGTILAGAEDVPPDHSDDIDRDHFAFEGEEDQRIEARVTGMEACVRIVNESMEPVDGYWYWAGQTCSVPGLYLTGFDDVTLPANGTYYLSIATSRPAGETPYSVSIGIGERVSSFDPILGLAR